MSGDGLKNDCDCSQHQSGKNWQTQKESKQGRVIRQLSASMECRTTARLVLNYVNGLGQVTHIIDMPHNRIGIFIVSELFGSI
jgi:hypothetical protein